jgi:adenylate cyclase
MPDYTHNTPWVTSKEILLKTGISRATLNNYIKMGIVPRPLVKKPTGDMKGTKKIGYFPYAVLDRIELVKQLKHDGNSMEDITIQFKDLPISVGQDTDVESRGGERETEFMSTGSREPLSEEPLELTLDDIRRPAYLINYDFQVEWVNVQAEDSIFWQRVSLIKDRESRNVFKLFFHWQFHNRVRNWRDLVAFHMSFARIKYTRSWMANIYRGISEKEAAILLEIYDRVEPFPVQTITDRTIVLLMEDGTSETFQVYSTFFKEGIFFLYGPSCF